MKGDECINNPLHFGVDKQAMTVMTIKPSSVTNTGTLSLLKEPRPGTTQSRCRCNSVSGHATLGKLPLLRAFASSLSIGPNNPKVSADQQSCVPNPVPSTACHSQ